MQEVRCLLMVDVVDSTAATVGLGEERAAELWAEHDRRSRELLRRWRGREIDRSDGLMCLFDTLADGAGFAADYHACLAGLTPSLRARAGLHWAPVLLRLASPEDRDLGARPLEVAGLGRAVVARLCALAGAGQTLASGEAAAALDGALPQGHWQFKGFEAPRAVFSLPHPLDPGTPPGDGEKARRVHRVDGAWLPANEIPHNLPPERDSFVGRSVELQALGRALVHRRERLVTLTGAGGIGKTRLARRYGAAWRGDHPGGVHFCDLASARDADGLLHGVAQVLGVPLGRAPLEQLGNALAARGRLLLVLDNLEQLAGVAPPLLARWLEAAPQLQCLVTSRERLGLPGECRIALDPLPPADARRLFRERAAGAATDDDEGPLDELVRRLDGLPLAIELAAARAALLPPRAMLERLDDRFRLLAGPVGRGRPDRQATLRAALDWSWEMLGPDERAALTQLAVFEGGFSLAAAEAVVDAPGRAWVPDLLQALVDRSLLQCATPGRFELLRSVQDYAQTHGRPADAERRHWQHFAALAPEAAGDDHEDLDNLVVACRRATAAGDAAAATRCLVAAWAQLRRRGPVRLGAELAQAVLAMPALAPSDQARAAAVGAAALNVLNDPSGALAIAVCALDLPEAGGAADRARLLSAAADAAAQLGEPAREEAFLARALELAQAPEVDVATRCAVFNALGAAAVDRHRGAEAQAWYRRGLEAARAAGDRRWQGALLGALGVQHHVAGQLDEAHALYRDALALSTEVGDRRWEGSTRCNLGLVLLDQGRLEGAADELRQALALARAQGQPRLEMVSACNLGLVAMARDDPGQAADHLRTTLAIARRLGDRRSAVQAHAYLAATLARAGRLDGAERELADGRAAAVGQELPLDEGLLDAAEVELAERRGDPPRAQAALARLDALIAAQALGPDTELGRWRVRLAALSRRA